MVIIMEIFAGEPTMSWSIVGAGKVGGSLIHQVAKPGIAPRLGLNEHPDSVLRRKGWHNDGNPQSPVISFEKNHPPVDSDVLFIASSSTASNAPMISLMHRQLDMGGIVVTAEKKTVGEHLPEFRKSRRRLGIWATDGGGTKMLPTLELHSQDPDNVREVILAQNATMTFAMGKIAMGFSPEETLAEAIAEGYAEPDAANAADALRVEITKDIPIKTVIALDTIFPNRSSVDIDDIKTDFSEDICNAAMAQADKYRYLVGVFLEQDEEQVVEMTRDRLGGFWTVHEGLLVVGGFMRVDRDNSFGEFNGSKGPKAGFNIKLGPVDGSSKDGETFMMGTGAGPDTTANAMLDNYVHIRRNLS